MVTTPSIEAIAKATDQIPPNDSVCQFSQSSIQADDKRPMIHLFDCILQQKHLFINRELLSPTYIPEILPHREQEINELAQILAPALGLETPSNVLLFGKPGIGKTAVVKLVGAELQAAGKAQDKQIHFIYVNCQLINSLYKILQHIGQQLSNNQPNKIPASGLPVDVVFSKIIALLDTKRQVLILCLDEADRIRDDCALYTLTRINEHLHKARVSIVLISNDLKCIETADARVISSLRQETLVYSPYDASQLIDILKTRCQQALVPNILSNDVVPLCAAIAAQEHGDARRALDLLRVSVELAERNHDRIVTNKHVRLAQNKIEKDRIAEVIHSLPSQERLVLHAINRLQRHKERMKKMAPITTGEIYKLYTNMARAVQYAPLTQRRAADFISELGTLGVINTRVISKGRSGRTREVQIALPSTELNRILQEDELYEEIDQVKMKNQMKLL